MSIYFFNKFAILTTLFLCNITKTRFSTLRNADGLVVIDINCQKVLLVPTAMNQQKFYLEYVDGKVSTKAKLSLYSKLDLGIVKYHFEVGAGKENFNCM